MAHRNPCSSIGSVVRRGVLGLVVAAQSSVAVSFAQSTLHRGIVDKSASHSRASLPVATTPSTADTHSVRVFPPVLANDAQHFVEHLRALVPQRPDRQLYQPRCVPLGHEVICTADEDLRARLQELTRGKGVERAIDCVAGELCAEIARNLAPAGTMLVYGALSSHRQTDPLNSRCPSSLRV